MRRSLVLMLICLLVPDAPVFGAGAGAERPPVDAAIVLAVDVSSSVDETRFRLQQSGYAAAFRSGAVQTAILGGPHHAIAVAYVQWAGSKAQHVAVTWTRVADEAEADALAARIEECARLDEGSTSISGAISFAMALLDAVPYAPDRRIIDVSGDGSNNSGRLAALARDEAVAVGITINGLPILAVEPELDSYYRDNVIGGSGAFLVPATDFTTFATAIASKLVREVAGGPVAPVGQGFGGNGGWTDRPRIATFGRNMLERRAPGQTRTLMEE